MKRTASSPTIHASGIGARLDAVVDLVAFSARPRPLTTTLDEMPRRIAKVFGADICSIYLLEGEDLVMRGNVGFPLEALGEVRLAIGQGITGRAVEYMRPISLDAAPKAEGYKYFSVLGEERFPIFLAVPIPGPTGPLGALVVQRKDGPPFDAADVELAAALTAPIAAVVERSQLVDALHQERSPSSGARRVTLSGRAVVHGRAVGAVHPLPRPLARPLPEPVRPTAELQKVLERATAQAQRTLEHFRRLAQHEHQSALPFLDGIQTILDDARLRERTLELASNGGPTQALAALGAEVVRGAERAGESFGVERAREIAEVCEALAVIASQDRRFEVPRGAILVGDSFTVFDLLVSARCNPAGVVLSEHAKHPMTRRFLSLVAVPALIDVAGLFRWVAEGEIALVDGDHGLLRLNPSRTEISAFRAEKKRAVPTNNGGTE